MKKLNTHEFMSVDIDIYECSPTLQGSSCNAALHKRTVSSNWYTIR